MSTNCEVGKHFVRTKGSVDPRVLTNGALHIFLRVFQEVILPGTFSVPFVAHVLHRGTHFLQTKLAISVNEVNVYTQTVAVGHWWRFYAWWLRRESEGYQMEQSRVTLPTLRSCTIVTEKH